MSTSIDVLDGVADSVGTKAPARVATTADMTGALIGLPVLDGYQVLAGDRILVWMNADTTTNGSYIASLAAWARAIDASGTSSFFPGTMIYVAEGTLYGNTLFVQQCLDNPVVVGVSHIIFAPYQDEQVSISQLKQGLAVVDTSTPPVVAGNIPSSPYNAVNICWNSAVLLRGDSLYRFVQAQLGYSNSQMAAFYETCAGYSGNP